MVSLMQGFKRTPLHTQSSAKQTKNGVPHGRKDAGEDDASTQDHSKTYGSIYYWPRGWYGPQQWITHQHNNLKFLHFSLMCTVESYLGINIPHIGPSTLEKCTFQLNELRIHIVQTPPHCFAQSEKEPLPLTLTTTKTTQFHWLLVLGCRFHVKSRCGILRWSFPHITLELESRFMTLPETAPGSTEARAKLIVSTIATYTKWVSSRTYYASQGLDREAMGLCDASGFRCLHRGP